MRQNSSLGVTIFDTPGLRAADVPGAPLIALLISPGSWRNRQLLDGISAYSRQHAQWRFALQEFTDRGAVDKWLLRAKPAGAIAEITSSGMAKTLRRAGMQVVDVLEEHAVPHVPQIVCDDQKLVRSAIDHLLDRGLRHLAFIGDRERHFARRRRLFFAEYLRLRHHQAQRAVTPATPEHVAMLPGASLLTTGQAGLADWLASLPKPVGVVACDDMWGAQVLRVCSERGLRVPDDVAVIGVDDDPIFCQISDPPLTSIDGNSHAIGYAAAALLDGMINRQASPPPITFVEPGAIQTRGSTDVLAIPDQKAVAAVRFVRMHACAGLTPTSAAAKLGMSVRTLERLFDRYLGHSPAVEIGRVRLERARDLLTATELPLADIAERAGFAHVESLHRIFKKRFTMSPGGYRRANTTTAAVHTGRPTRRRRRT